MTSHPNQELWRESEPQHGEITKSRRIYLGAFANSRYLAMSFNESESALWDSYKATIVEITHNGLVLSDRELYEIWKTDFYMITAANPFSNPLSDEKNNARNAELRAHLNESYQEILAGRGKDPAGGWVEEGWVICGGDEERLISLAKKFEQNAIFKFTAAGREILDCR